MLVATAEEARLDRAYEANGDAWASGPAAAYEQMSALAVDGLPGPLAGELVLDLGAGTGATSRCILRRGARPVALDPAGGMLRRAAADVVGLLPVQGRGEALPLRPGSCAAAVAAFSLSHLEDPVTVLRDVRRVLRPAGAFAAVGYGPQESHPAKEIVERVAQSYGFVSPAWYRRLKALEEHVNDPDTLRTLVTAAGFEDVCVSTAVVETGVAAPADLLRWRLGIPHLAQFAARLMPSERSAFVRDAEAALAPMAQPWRPRVLVLGARSSSAAA